MRRPKRKQLGQHFLKDRRALTWFKNHVCKYDVAVEIGAGYGALTRGVRECLKTLIALEIDTALAEALRGLTDSPQVEVTVADALQPPINPSRIDAIFGSIPYSITGELIYIIVKEFQKPAFLLLQREVGMRLAAKPGTGEYGRLTVVANAVYNVELGPVLPPSSFNPPPKVYSVLVKMEPWRRCEPEYIEKLSALLACLFAERRKRAEKVVSKCLGISKREAAGIIGSKRIYELSIHDIEELLKLSGDKRGCVEISGRRT